VNFLTGLSSESFVFNRPGGDSHDLLVRDKSVSTVVESERKFLVIFSNYALFLGAYLPVIDIFVPATVFVTKFRFESSSHKCRIRKAARTQ